MVTRWWEAWLRLRERVHALKPCRVAILLVLAGLAFLLLASQGEDVARALAERRTNDAISSQAFWFFAAVLAWSVSAWYWARTMLSLRLPGMEVARHAHGVRIWTPRLLGFLAPLGVAAAFYKAAGGYAIDEHQEVKELLQFYGFWCAAGAVAFLVAVSARRRVSRAAYRIVKLEFLNLPHVHEQDSAALRLRELGMLTRSILVGAILASILLFDLMVFRVQEVAPALGSAAIVLLAAAGWIAVASALDYLGMRFHLPVFSALLATAVVFSLWNDNHAVRTLPEAQPAQRPNLRASLRAWIARHDAAIQSGGTVPFFVVDAEGGGIRAAYWTVTVLGEIQNRHPSFASHVFSLSGVSGGSLGASVFVALLNESRESAAPFDLKKKGQQILGEDFLSPAVAAILYPDLVQRFLPLPVSMFDRATTLEQSWERAWHKHVGGRNRMSEPFDRLWEGRSEWTPALLLNATWVETGKRIIASNMRVAAGRRREDFVDVEDANAFFAPRSISLSTAAHMSARFTYVSPAGSLEKGGRTYGRVVDGGYFENSGAGTLAPLIRTITRSDPVNAKRLVLIIFSNDPSDGKSDYVCPDPSEDLEPLPIGGRDTWPRFLQERDPLPSHFGIEVTAPAIALYQTRTSRAHAASVVARNAIDRDKACETRRVVELRIPMARVKGDDLPMSWFLNDRTQVDLERLVTAPADAANTPARRLCENLEAIRGWIENQRQETAPNLLLTRCRQSGG